MRVKVPINQPYYANVDTNSLTSTSELLINCNIDESGSCVRRPGLELMATASEAASVTGLFWWDAKNSAVVVAGGTVYILTEDGSISAISSVGYLSGTLPVSFALHGDTLILANGGQMVSTDGATCAYLSDPDAPTTVSHVTYMDQYLIANNYGTSEFHFSEVGTWDTWWAIDYLTAELKPDDLDALFSTAWGELMLFGKESVEVWYDDAVSPFTPFPGAHSIRGCSEAYTIALAGKSFVYLDNKKNVVSLENREAVNISLPINKLIYNSDTEGAIGFYMEFAGRNLYILSLPAANYTFCYDFLTKTWSRWSYWNEFEASHDCWRGRSTCFCPSWGVTLIGDSLDSGKVFKLSDSVYTDDSDVIISSQVTGHLDHGTSKRKRSNKLTLKLRRGDTPSGSDTNYMAVKWRDDGHKIWSNERFIDLGLYGDTTFNVDLFRLGIYKSRQYQFTFSSNTPMVLVSAEEDIIELR